ncbi:MAG: cation diffusion facilitator family transporter [Actinobacteria bacterium]|nr:cation diffusion facilitator family transporter [Actinomycetota bacterium]
MSASGSRKAIIAAFLANLGIAVAKFVGFAVTGASSMLSEGIHSVADTGNQGLLLLGGRRASKAADDEHPFGYGRERFFWSFVVAVVLFSLGSVFSIYEGVHKIRHPEQIESPMVAVAILVVAILLESTSLRTAVRESRPLKRGATWWQFLRGAKAPELPVVLLEDAGAVVGLVVALGAIGLSVTTGDAVYDGIGSLLIGVLLGVVAVFLCIEVKSLLIGEAASPEDRRRIEDAIVASPGVVRLIHCRTEHIGAEHILVGAKVEFSGDLDIAGLAHAVDGVEASIRSVVVDARTIYIEPDLHRDAGVLPGGPTEGDRQLG